MGLGSWWLEYGLSFGTPEGVPQMVFQPLVENAIKHGVADRATGGRIQVSARALDGRLLLAVQDDGVGLKGKRPTNGLGLTNTRDRLAFLYGERHEFKLGEAPGGGVRVDISIPFQQGATTDLSG